jgi:hypothetical protein
LVEICERFWTKSGVLAFWGSDGKRQNPSITLYFNIRP